MSTLTWNQFPVNKNKQKRPEVFVIKTYVQKFYISNFNWKLDTKELSTGLINMLIKIMGSNPDLLDLDQMQVLFTFYFL